VRDRTLSLVLWTTIQVKEVESNSFWSVSTSHVLFVIHSLESCLFLSIELLSYLLPISCLKRMDTVSYLFFKRISISISHDRQPDHFVCMSLGLHKIFISRCSLSLLFSNSWHARQARETFRWKECTRLFMNLWFVSTKLTDGGVMSMESRFSFCFLSFDI